MNLSPHFTLAEACASNKAREKGLDNRPTDPRIIERLRYTALTILEPVRAHFGNRPIIYNGFLSWYRTPAVNVAAGGVPTSQHMSGEAVDIEIAGISNLDIAHFIRDKLEFDQLILEFYNGIDPSSGWVHASAVADRVPRGETWTFTNGKKKLGLA
tara:strand:- start:3666 stop:4133 length:468 start_codon:yes stop_codon:yes gene_type:complete